MEYDSLHGSASHSGDLRCASHFFGGTTSQSACFDRGEAKLESQYQCMTEGRRKSGGERLRIADQERE